MDEDRKVTLDDYKASSRKKGLFLVALGVVLVFVAILSIAVGGVKIPYSDIIRHILHPNTSTHSIVIWRWRLPIAIGAIAVGAALGIAGAVMQCILKNPLGSPYTLGLSSAAAFGASLGIMTMEGLLNIAEPSPYLITVSAFAWSMVATTFIIVMAKHTSISPEAMVLAGVAISSIFSAGVSAMQYFATDRALAAIVYWQFGDVTKLTWNKIVAIVVTMVPGVAYFMYKRWDYNALDTGDETARCLGVNINSTRILGMVVASIITAVAVSFVGVIGFIGLLGPHIVRRLLGSDHRFLLPGSMLVGALVLLAANFVAQNAFSFVMPVGIITSFLGGPLFLYILLRSYKGKKVV